jgi:hypothetical protein
MSDLKDKYDLGRVRKIDPLGPAKIPTKKLEVPQRLPEYPPLPPFPAGETEATPVLDKIKSVPGKVGGFILNRAKERSTRLAVAGLVAALVSLGFEAELATQIALGVLALIGLVPTEKPATD